MAVVNGPRLSRLLKKLIEYSIANSYVIDYAFKHFSFIVERSKILAIGYNDPWKTHPLAKKFGHRFACKHSELSVILNYPFPVVTFKRCVLINTRVDNSHCIRLAKPCQFCQRMLAVFSFKKVLYTTNKGGFATL